MTLDVCSGIAAEIGPLVSVIRISVNCNIRASLVRDSIYHNFHLLSQCPSPALQLLSNTMYDALIGAASDHTHHTYYRALPYSISKLVYLADKLIGHCVTLYRFYLSSLNIILFVTLCFF